MVGEGGKAVGGEWGSVCSLFVGEVSCKERERERDVHYYAVCHRVEHQRHC